jgi:putative salt-induced outer membrane protein
MLLPTSRLGRIASLILALGFAVGSAAAQSDSTHPAPPPAPAPPPKPPPFATIHTDLGYVNTSGNTQVQTLNFTDQLVLNTSPLNKVTQVFGVVYGTNMNRVQTSQWNAGLRDEYSLGKHLGLYGLLGWDRNTFAGTDYRFEEGGGVAFIPIDAPRDRLEIDVGASYIEAKSTFTDTLGILRDSSDKYAAARTAIIYRHTFVKDTYIQQTVEGIPDLETSENYRINTQTDVVAPLSKHIAVKLGYTLKYVNLPPPGFQKMDRLFTSDLQFTF